MALIPEIAFDNVEVSKAVEEKINGKVAKLASRFDRLTHARIVVSAPNRGPHRPKAYAVKITLGLPGRADLVASSGAILTTSIMTSMAPFAMLSIRPSGGSTRASPACGER